MNNIEINRILTSCVETKKHFVGVYASDTLPTHPPPPSRRPCSYICNLDPLHASGSHWVAFYFPQHGPGEYFDSYGFDIPSLFYDFIGVQEDYIFNTCFLQHPLSAVCGQYCIFYVWQRGKRRDASMNGVLSIFRADDHYCNDTLVNALVEKRFDVDLNVYDIAWQNKQLHRHGSSLSYDIA